MSVLRKLKRIPSWCAEFCIALITGALALIGLVTLLVVVINLSTGTCVGVTDYTELCVQHTFAPGGSPP
jgi:hypothetical protein